MSATYGVYMMHAHVNYNYGNSKTSIPSNEYPPLQFDAPNMCLYVAHIDNILAPMYMFEVGMPTHSTSKGETTMKVQSHKLVSEW